MYQPAGRIVDEDQQRTGIASVFKPAMVAAIDLDQLSKCFTPQSRLMEAAALLAGSPQTFRHHPLTQRLSGDLQVVFREKHLSGKRWTEISVLRPHKFYRVLADAFYRSVV
jgi:hypothetical protein